MAVTQHSLSDFHAHMRAEAIPTHRTLGSILRQGQRWKRKRDGREVTIRTVYPYDRKALVQCCGQHRFLVSFGELRSMYSLEDLGHD